MASSQFAEQREPATITWMCLTAAVGTYRIQHYNAHKNVLGKIVEFVTTNARWPPRDGVL